MDILHQLLRAALKEALLKSGRFSSPTVFVMMGVYDRVWHSLIAPTVRNLINKHEVKTKEGEVAEGMDNINTATSEEDFMKKVQAEKERRDGETKKE